MTFTDELRARNLPVLRWTAIVFNPVYLLWSLIDHALVPHHATTFLVLRSICVAIATGIVLSAHLRPMKSRSLELFALFLIVYGCFLVPMLPLSGASFLDYALGFTLVLIGAGSIPSWAPSWSIGVIVALMAAAAPALIRSDIPAGHLLTGASYIATAGAISIVASIFKHGMLRREFDLREELRLLSLTDTLTGLLNRRCLDERLDLEMARALRYGRTLSALVIDVDHFKKINDMLGHEGGDRALAQLADILRSSLRQTDVAARMGGEEFVVLATETPLSGAMILAERLRLDIQVRAGFTVSIGVASTEHPEASSSRAIINLADVALYEAKHSGRNRVCAAEPPQPKFQPPLTTRLVPEM